MATEVTSHSSGEREVAGADHVEDAIGAAEVEDHAGHAEEEHQHGDDLGRARDGAPPLRVRQAQDGGDQRAGVADADEEDEIRDVEAPEDRRVEAGHAEAAAQLRPPGEGAPQPDGQEDPGEDLEAPPGRLDRGEQPLVGTELKRLHPMLLSTGRSPSASCPAPRGGGRPADSAASRATMLRGSSRSPKNIASAGTALHAGRHVVALAQRAVLEPGLILGLLEPVMAEGAFLDDALRADRDVGAQPLLHRLGPLGPFQLKRRTVYGHAVVQ